MGENRDRKGPIFIEQTPEELAEGSHNAAVYDFPQPRDAARRIKIAKHLKPPIKESTAQVPELAGSTEQIEGEPQPPGPIIA